MGQHITNKNPEYKASSDYGVTRGGAEDGRKQPLSHPDGRLYHDNVWETNSIY